MNKRKLLALIVVAWSGSISSLCSAQVANGDFTNGVASWNWYHASADAVFGSPPYCSTLVQSSFTPSTSSDTPSVGVSPAAGRVARLTDYDSYPLPGSSTRLICRKVTQAVYVPPSKRLKFVLKIGDSISFQGTGVTQADMTVDILVIKQNGATTLVYTRTGKDTYCPIQSNCPVYVPVDINMSQFGGQTVALIIRSSTSLSVSGSSVSSAPSSAYIDNVRIE